MTFSTATIQGYVTFKKASTTPNGRSVVNMLLSVPNKRQNGTIADTYKVSVWDSQALAAAEYISAERKQIITCSGTLKLDEYSIANPNPKSGKIEPMMRLDFASILDYGNTKPTQEQVSDKQKFVNMMDSVDEVIDKAKSVKAKATTISKSK
mgnify:CR=1 FL=1